ncbi:MULTISPECIES: IS110 family transposase [unclassified Bifidobacterium]|uniref:IS110 family transposase n=1 Tax=unclassified Bifidobacterium TaxID=2608897 RepID=UPI00112A4727|nr:MULTISPECIES: IS110 family transposase [unclassified Bifidobacterium]TPF79105.1 transposase [Bifidobacterium sp. UTCIF-1]TPF80976.1 transposase [Bifidobacterium sp. UTCIF-24]TPF83227.1 transposase [Bifidobacterium sp. UTCIF-3]TPF85012.1 transposase [Bifidobacterium sp. UTCIF-36]TPF87748.1 transposase [Bifidobacterium sp. UTBIF-56]
MEPPTTVIAGVDTHADTHTLALLDTNGRVISTETFETSPDGYGRLIDALGKPSRCAGIGVEGTNSFGAALARRLSAGGFPVYEVLRPNRGVRRKDGKSDPIDAIAAARGVLAGEATSLPKSSDGWVEALRHLNAERSQLVAAMTMLANSTGGLLVTAPEPVRERYRGLRTETRMNHLASCRPSGGLVAHSVLTALKSAAKAWKTLKEQADLLEERMRRILEANARPLLDIYCAGTITAATIAIVAGDNPERIRDEAAFAKLCGACPIPASSGKTNRHRLNRGGNRQGNMALHRIAIVRLRYHQPTRDYVSKKTREGKSKLEIIRCLKRYIAREAYKALLAIRNGNAGQRETPRERGARLRRLRTSHGITQQQVGEALAVPSSRISEIERGTRNLPELEQRATQWIHSITTPTTQHSQPFDNK